MEVTEAMSVALSGLTEGENDETVPPAVLSKLAEAMTRDFRRGWGEASVVGLVSMCVALRKEYGRTSWAQGLEDWLKARPEAARVLATLATEAGSVSDSSSSSALALDQAPSASLLRPSTAPTGSFKASAFIDPYVLGRERAKAAARQEEGNE